MANSYIDSYIIVNVIRHVPVPAGGVRGLGYHMALKVVADHMHLSMKAHPFHSLPRFVSQFKLFTSRMRRAATVDAVSAAVAQRYIGTRYESPRHKEETR